MVNSVTLHNVKVQYRIRVSHSLTSSMPPENKWLFGLLNNITQSCAVVPPTARR